MFHHRDSSSQNVMKNIEITECTPCTQVITAEFFKKTDEPLKQPKRIKTEYRSQYCLEKPKLKPMITKIPSTKTLLDNGKYHGSNGELQGNMDLPQLKEQILTPRTLSERGSYHGSDEIYHGNIDLTLLNLKCRRSSSTPTLEDVGGYHGSDGVCHGNIDLTKLYVLSADNPDSGTSNETIMSIQRLSSGYNSPNATGKLDKSETDGTNKSDQKCSENVQCDQDEKTINKWDYKQSKKRLGMDQKKANTTYRESHKRYLDQNKDPRQNAQDRMDQKETKSDQNSCSNKPHHGSEQNKTDHTSSYDKRDQKSSKQDCSKLSDQKISKSNAIQYHGSYELYLNQNRSRNFFPLADQTQISSVNMGPAQKAAKKYDFSAKSTPPTPVSLTSEEPQCISTPSGGEKKLDVTQMNQAGAVTEVIANFATREDGSATFHKVFTVGGVGLKCTCCISSFVDCVDVDK